MANSFWKVRKGIALIPTDSGANPAVADPTDNVEGSLWVFGNSVKSYVNGAIRTIATLDQTQALTNKTIVALSNTITTAANGNLTAVELNAALKQLQDHIDTASGSISGHTGASTNVHGTGVGSAVVGTTDSQALTNKTIDATLNTISKLADTNIASNAAIALTKLATVTASKVLVSDTNGNISASSISTTTLGYLDATSSIQTQLNGKQASGSYITASSSDVLTNKTIDADNNTISNISNSQIKSAAAIALNKLAAVTASMTLVSDASGFVSASSVSATTLGYLDATSSVQTQINGKISASSSDALTNKTIDATLNTISKIADGNISVTAAIALGKLAALTASKALVSDASGVISASTITATELGRLSGIGSTADGINDSNVLTNKTLTSPAINGANISMGTASNTNKITVPTNTTTLLNGLTRTAGNIYYSTSENKYYGDNGAALVDMGAGGGGITALTGEVTASGTGSVAATITNSAVTNAKLANMAYNTVKGNLGAPHAPGDLNSMDIKGLAGASDRSYYKNFIKNPNGELDISGWVTFADAAGTIPVDGIGGTSDITWTRNINTPLTYTPYVIATDLLLTKDAANRQGQGVTYYLDIPPGERVGKVFGITFTAKTYSGTYTNGDLKIFAYDFSNSVLLNGGVAIVDVNAGSSPVQHPASVYVPSTCTALRFIIHETTTNATAYALQFSDFQFTNNPYAVQNTVDTQGSRYSAYAGQGSSSTKIPYFTTLDSSTGSGIYSITNDSTYGMVITALRPCQIALNWGGLISGGNENIGISLNSNQLTTALSSITAQNRLSYLSLINTANNAGYATTDVSLTTGDILRPHLDVGGRVTTTSSLQITASATSPHIVTPAKSGIEEIYYDGYTSKDGSGFVKFKTSETVNQAFAQVAVADNTTYTKFTALKKAFVSAFASGSAGSTGAISIIHKNAAGTTLRQSNAPLAGSGTAYAATPFTAILQPTDYIIVYSSAAFTDNAIAAFSATFVDFNQQVLSAIPIQKTCYIKDVKAQNTSGGTFTLGAWRTRDLNVINETGSIANGTCSFASLSANQFTLQPGTYRINAMAPAYAVALHQAKLYDITNSADVLFSKSTPSEVSASLNIDAIIIGTVTIPSATVYEIRDWCTSTKATLGFGSQCNIAPEVYTQIEIGKVV